MFQSREVGTKLQPQDNANSVNSVRQISLSRVQKSLPILTGFVPFAFN